MYHSKVSQADGSRATVRDVAAKAGVSPTVVSHVLNGRATGIRVSGTTADRVRAAAIALGYRRNSLAGSLRDKRTCVLGVLHGSAVERPRFSFGSRYFASLMDGIVEGAFEHGYSVTLCPKLLGDSQAEGISDGRFDGLIWYQRRDTEEDERTAASCLLPMVFIHSSIGGTNSIWPSVSCDNDQGVLLALQHLAGLGHKKVAFVIEPWAQNGEGVTRIDSFHRACRLLHLQGDLVLFRPDLQDEVTLIEDGFTGVLAWNDESAGALMGRLIDQGAKLPQDLSIIGFDSTSYCGELTPKLTSVHQPLHAIGRNAAEILIKQISGEEVGVKPLLLPCRLDIRESTGPPAL